MNDSEATIGFQNVPADWDLKEFGQVASLKSGGSAPQGNEYFKDGKYPFIRVQHFNGTEKYLTRWDLISDKAVKDCRLKLFKKDTILFPKSGASIMLEKRAKLPFDAYVVGHLCCVEPEGVENDFLFFLLKYVKFAHTINGSTLPYLNLNHLAKWLIPIPPRPEQRRIAYILNILQTSIEQQARQIALMRELKSALMHKLFSEGLRGEKQKETEIGLVPESWEVVKILQAYKFTDKKKGSKLPQPIPFIPMELIPIGQKEIVRYETREKAASGTYVEKGDLLIAKITPSFENGKQGILKIPFANALATTEVIPIKAIEGKSDLLYLHYFLLKSDVRSAMAGKMDGTTGRQRLSKAIVGEQLLPLPKISEQEEISQNLSIFDDKILITHQKKEKLEELFRTLLQQLMTGQMRVNEIDLPGLWQGENGV